MKKFLAVLLAVVVVVLACFFFFSDEEEAEKSGSATLATMLAASPKKYPHYASLSAQEKDAYAQICSAAQNFKKTVTRVYTDNTQRGVEKFISELQTKVVREIAYEHPEMFWYDPYNFQYTIMSNGKEFYLDVTLSYLFDKDTAMGMKSRFNEKVDAIVTEAKKKTDTYEQVLFVHDTILENCDYDNVAYENEDFSSSSINAYGCLVDGKAICSGYAMAFNTVMKRLGYEIGVEFNTYNGLSIFGEGHVWNYCKLDGEYYYFDLTWDDTDPGSELYDRQPYSHSYFAITTAEMEAAHLMLAYEAETPACEGTKYNYFVQNGLNFSDYDFETVKPVIQAQGDKECIELRFDTYSELLSAERDLIENDKIFDIFPDAKRCKYYSSKSNLQLYIFMI